MDNNISNAAHTTAVNNPEPQRTDQNQSDDKTIVSDRCWVPQYKSDSHKWLIRDGHAESLQSQRVSTMKDSFVLPHEDTRFIIGRRAEILLERMRLEAEAEAIAERTQQPTAEKYITTYDDTYCPSDPNFEPKPLPRAHELYDKYPLYSNPAASYWKQQYSRRISERPAIGGIMKPVDSNNPFKRNAQFSKPIEEITDGSQIYH